MFPNPLLADIAVARAREFRVEAKGHHRAGFAHDGRSLDAVVQVIVRQLTRIWTNRGVPEAAAT